MKFIITRDPHYDTMKFDPKQWQKRIATVASIMDVTDVSLDKFRAKGGKIIMTHGTADDFITPHNSIEYYQRQVADFGQSGVEVIRCALGPASSRGFLPRMRGWVSSRAPLDDQEAAPAGGVLRLVPLVLVVLARTKPRS